MEYLLGNQQTMVFFNACGILSCLNSTEWNLNYRESGFSMCGQVLFAGPLSLKMLTMPAIRSGMPLAVLMWANGCHFCPPSRTGVEVFYLKLFFFLIFEWCDNNKLNVACQIIVHEIVIFLCQVLWLLKARLFSWRIWDCSRILKFGKRLKEICASWLILRDS